MAKYKELSVSAIKNGTVIDQIPADALFKVIQILKLDDQSNDKLVTFGRNLESSKLGKKSIIKVADTFFKDAEINKIALVAKEARLSIIKDYDVVEKKQVNIPQDLIGIAKCMNPMCITNNQPVVTHLHLLQKEPLELRCHYCEKVTTEEYIEVG